MLGAIKLTDLATLGLLEQATSGWIWSETGAQTRHTAERWPAPGTHAGSYLRTVQLAKDIDKVAGSLCRPLISTLIWSLGCRRAPANLKQAH